MTAEITLTIAQADATTFDLYSNVDGFSVPFETGISKAVLLAGYMTTLVPDNTISVRVQSTGPICVNSVDILLVNTTTTTTTTVAPITTTTTTTTAAPAIACDETTNSGGPGVTEYILNLEDTGGSIIMDFDAQGISDKLEIIHNGVKVATSGMTVSNSGPFEDVYGDPTVPTALETASLDQFIGTNKGTVPNRDAAFLSDTGITTITRTKQQLIWWVYDITDFSTDPQVTIRITGPTDTVWVLNRLCE